MTNDLDDFHVHCVSEFYENCEFGREENCEFLFFHFLSFLN